MSNPRPPQPPRSVSRFSGELNFSEMARDAEDVERIVSSIPDPPKRGRKAAKAPTAPAPGPAAAPPVTGGTEVKVVESTLADWEPLNLGPEFPIMMVSLVQFGTDFMKKSKNWADPGAIWHKQLGEALARIIERILGRILHGRQEAAGDLIVLGSYISMYVVANTILNRQPAKQIGGR